MAVSKASAVVVPFYAAVEARAAKVNKAISGNAATVTLVNGREVAQRSLRVTQSDQYARAFADKFSAFYDDAQVSRVPVRIAAAAWESYREAVKSFGENHGMKVRYGGEKGDCRSLELLYKDASVGQFSILDTATPRSPAEIARDLQILINSSLL